MKVVINSKYGGFGLSYVGVMRYAELKGIKLYPWLDNITKEAYKEKATLDNSGILCVHYTTVPEEEYNQIVEEDKLRPNEPGKFERSNALYFSARDISRTDLLLIQVVEELGKKADSRFANLKIIEIPDDVEWEIEEYDGQE